MPPTTKATPTTPPVGAPPAFQGLCAICLRHPTPETVPAVTSVNGTAVCALHCQTAPSGALPYPAEDV